LHNRGLQLDDEFFDKGRQELKQHRQAHSRCERSDDAHCEVLFPVPGISLRVGAALVVLKLFSFHPGQSLLHIDWLTVCAPTLDGAADLRNFLYQRVE
jgi:hypothetical protein